MTFGLTIEDVVDDLVQMDTVQRVDEVIRKRDKAVWYLNDQEAISKLRVLRNQIEDEVLLKNVIRSLEDL